MTTPRELCHAYVLHARPYKEKSRLIELWTLEEGRISAVGKPTVPLFQPCLIGWRGKSSLKTLASCEQAGLPLILTGDALFAGFYLNELLVRLLPPDDPQPALFALYGDILHHLHDPAMLEPALRRFEKQLLAVIGYELAFHIDEGGKPLHPQRFYQYFSQQGLVESPEGWSGAILQQVGSDDYGDVQARRAAKHILRQALAEHLGPTPLKSRELWLRTKT